MKTFFAVILIIVGLVTIFSYPNLGVSAAETAGAIFGISVFTFVPAIFLIRSDQKNKTSN